MSSKTALITGGAGFIVSHLVEILLNLRRRVIVIDDLSTGNLENLKHLTGNPNLEIHQAKVSECSKLDSLVEQSSEIYHLAAVVGVDLVMRSQIQTIQNNLNETEILLEAAA